MSKEIIIIGASGHAKVIADIVLSCGEELLGFLDDNIYGTVFGYPVLDNVSSIARYASSCSFLIGVGNNQTRKRLAEKYNVSWHTAIHPSAIIANSVLLGEGSVVMANAVVNPATKIGKHCIINTSAVVEHDNIICDYVHISPHATLCGTVNIGELTHIGAGAKVSNNVSISSDCIIGAGAVVVKNIVEPGIYIGVPARKMK